MSKFSVYVSPNYYFSGWGDVVMVDGQIVALVVNSMYSSAVEDAISHAHEYMQDDNPVEEPDGL